MQPPASAAFQRARPFLLFPPLETLLFSGITTFCFAASYTVALALEASRMLFRSGIRGVLMLAFGGAGLLAHTLFLYHRAVTASPQAPLSSSFDWYMLAAWLLAAVYFYLTYYHRTAAIGLFVLPLVLGLVGAAQLADPEPFPQTPAAQVWGSIHGIFWLLGTVAVMFGFVVGLMYLFQARRLKKKLPPMQGLRMPSLEWLARSSSRAIVLSAIMIGLGLASGAILNVVNHSTELDYVPWSDPAIVTSAAMFLWLLATAVFSAAYRPARQSRKVAYLTVANFVFLAISLGVMLLTDTDHGSSTQRRSDTTRRQHEIRGDSVVKSSGSSLQAMTFLPGGAS